MAVTYVTQFTSGNEGWLLLDYVTQFTSGNEGWLLPDVCYTVHQWE